jgi:hypothetical protein
MPQTQPIRLPLASLLNAGAGDYGGFGVDEVEADSTNLSDGDAFSRPSRESLRIAQVVDLPRRREGARERETLHERVSRIYGYHLDHPAVTP